MKTDAKRKMKSLALILALPLAALAVTVEPLPPSEYADTEVSTNMAFVVDRTEMTRIEFTVELDATPTNNVEVAIGTDGNGDGNLSVEESAYVFGYDCGTWFERSQSKSKVEVEERWLDSCSGCPAQRGSGVSPLVSEAQAGKFQSSTSNFDYSSPTFILKMRKLDTAWNLVKVTRRGCGAVCELVKAEGRKPGLVLEVR